MGFMEIGTLSTVQVALVRKGSDVFCEVNIIASVYYCSSLVFFVFFQLA